VLASRWTRARLPRGVATTMVRLHTPEHVDLDRGTAVVRE